MGSDDGPPALSAAEALSAYTVMVQARAVDDRLWQLSRQGRAHFVITSAGHEATQVGMALAIHAGHDYVVPYYRDMALVLALGQTPRDLLLHAMGRAADPASGGRQMYGHFSSRARRIVSGSSSVGSHLVHAVGLAFALRIGGERDTAVVTSFGEGATAEGAWHEALTIAVIQRLPVVFVCESNQYAISMPHHAEVPVADVALKAAGYGMPGEVVDGNDLRAVALAMRRAMARARADGGPTLLECKTYRLRPHSNADDDRRYRAAAEVDAWRVRDPIGRFGEVLVREYGVAPAVLAQIAGQARAEVDQATLDADAAPAPHPVTIADHVFGTATGSAPRSEDQRHA
jgi:2-oxoisovalerate dehydrogenase E1 component alpha subunit